MRSYLFIFALLSFPVFGQISTGSVLMIGNHSSICYTDSAAKFLTVEKSEELPDSLNSYQTIFVFSNSTSALSDTDVDRLVFFVGGLYLGSENWPLQAESNQLTKRMYFKESFGAYEQDVAEVASRTGNLHLDSMKNIPAGQSTVAFPMDYRLKVEAWVGDQPLILSGKLEAGKIIIDGGYSRFYCEQRSAESDQILQSFIDFLRSRND
jgi:hypothetical protein